MNNRNLGRFTIPMDMVEDHPEEVADIFRKLRIVPTRCELMQHSLKFEYYAIGEQFEEVKKGMMIPEYEILVTKDVDEKIKSVRAEKI